MLRVIERVLVVDDDQLILTAWVRSQGRQRSIFTATGSEAALDVARRERPELAVVDLRIGPESGIALVGELKRELPQMTIVLFSGYLSVVTTSAAMRAGADAVLFKPTSPGEILRRVEQDALEDASTDETPTLARAEWEHINRVLADCNGNISMAARRLGIYRSSLQRRLRKLAPAE